MKPTKLTNFFRTSIYALAVRHGLTLAIPFLIMGSFALLIINFPYTPYLDFLESFLGGAFKELMTSVYDITLGSLALLLILTISLSFGRLCENDGVFLYPVVSLVSYLAFCGGITGQKEYIFGAEWVSTAMYHDAFLRPVHKGKTRRALQKLHMTGAEYLYNLAVSSLIPAVIILLIFAVSSLLLRSIWQRKYYEFGSYLFLRLFENIENLPGITVLCTDDTCTVVFRIHGTK